MGFDLEKRVASELNRLEDDVARSPDIKPNKRLEHFRRIAAELKQRMLGGESAEEAPGKRTQIDELVGNSIANMQATAARAQEQLGRLPWQANAGFDDFRARGLREVIQTLGSERASLQRATVGAADPAIAARVQTGKRPKANEPGQAMWRVAERRAATLYRHAMDAGEVASEDPIVDEALARAGSGTALPTAVRKKMEAELGISLARVRVHTDPVAAAAAKAVRAAAFTVGEDIFFAEQQFAPDSREGQRLLAHELTHVVQAYQGRTSTGSGGYTVSQPGESLEREADAVADRIERRAERGPKVEAQGRWRMGTDVSRYAPANKPISVSGPPAAKAAGPAVASAPVIAAPTAGSSAQLLRRPAQDVTNENRARLPRDQQNNDQKGTQPRFERLRDRVKEEGLRATKKGTKLDTESLASEGKRVLKGAVTDLKGEVKKAVNKPVGKKAKDAGKSDKSKQKNLKKQAASAKKQVKAAKKKAGKAAGVAKAQGGGEKDSGGPVKFKKISDWQRYMPEDLPDTDAREKKRILGLIKKKVNGERKQSQGMLNKLANAQKAEAGAVRAMGPALAGQITAGMGKAIGQVSAAEGSQVAAVQAAVAAQQGRVRGHAAAMVGQINGAHATAMASIRAADRAAKTTLTTAKTTTLAAITTARAAALVSVNLEYIIATGRIIAIGAAKAAEATALPSQISLPYSGDKLEAAEKAAKEVAGQYAEAMPGEASKAAADLRSTKAEVDTQVNDMAESQREAVEQCYTQAKQIVDDATRGATEAANQIKTQSVTQVNSAASTTSAQLGTLGQQSVAGIRSAASSARAGITSAGTSAAAGLKAAVAKAASGIESGVGGLVKGSKQIEAPDPGQTRKQVMEAGQALKQGTQQLQAGFKQTVTGAVTGMTTQASGAAQGMAQQAAGAKASATQMATGACTSMTGIASGAKDSLTQMAEGHRTNVTATADAAKTQMKDMADKLTEAYGKLRTHLAGKLSEACENVRSQFTTAVPNEERPAILENAKKAADAVKPWWQKALAFVVQIVVAVAITIAVAAIVGATGGLALVAVGLVAGALSTVGGQMAHNAVMGESLFNGITVRSVLAGAIGGAVTAGFGAGLASGLNAAGRTTVATTLATKGAGGVGGAMLRTGAGVAGDLVGDVASQFVATGSYSFSMQNLATSIVMNGATQGSRYGDFETRMQQGIRSRVPSVDISTGRGNSPMGARPDGQTGNYFNAQGNARGNQGNLATPAAPPRRGADSTPAGGDRNGAGAGSGDRTPSNPAPSGGDRDGGTPQNTRGSDNPAPTNRPAGDSTNSDGSTPRPARNNGGDDSGGTGGNRNSGDSTNNNGGTRPRGDGDADGGRTSGRDNTSGDRDGAPRPAGDRDGDGSTTTRRDGDAAPNRDGEGNAPRRDTDGNQNRGDGDGNQNRPRGGGDRDGGGGDRDGGDRDGGGNNNRGGDDDGGGSNNRGGDEGDDGGNAPKSDGPENDQAGDLADMGYPNATRAKGDEAAGAVESGGRPNQDALRDTDANAEGKRQLQQVDNDPTLTPESRQNIRRDVAEQLRADEPSGNLPRDIAEARTREQTRLAAEQAKVDAAAAAAPKADGQNPADGANPAAPKDGAAPTTADGNAPRFASDGGATPAKVAEVTATAKGARPDPAEYLSPEYVARHQAAFADGGSRIVLESSHNKYGTFREDGSTFVMTRADADALLARANGDPAKLELELGLPAGQLSGGGGLVRIDFPAGDLRIPTGNEAGANDQWIPGGRTPNGNYEAVARTGTSGTETVTPIAPAPGSGPPSAAGPP